MNTYIEALSKAFKTETGTEPQEHHIKLFEALYKLEVLGQKKGKKKGYYIEKLIQLLEV